MIFLLQRIKIGEHKVKQTLVDFVTDQVHNDSLKFAVIGIKQVVDFVGHIHTGESRGIACPSLHFPKVERKSKPKAVSIVMGAL